MNKKIFIILIGILVIVSIGQIISINNLNGNLSGNDPWYHLRITEFTLEYQKIIVNVPNTAQPVRVEYITLFPITSAVYSLITGLSPLLIFQFIGLFLLLIISLFIFIIAKRLSRYKWAPYISLILFLSINTLLTRINMGIPENFALFYLAAIFFILISGESYVLIIFFLVTYTFYHYRSLIIPFFLIGAYVLLLNKKIMWIKRNFYKILVSIITYFVLSLPVLIELFKSYLFLLYEYLGVKESWSNYIQMPLQYKPFGLNDYLFNFNILFFILFFLSIIYFIKNINKIKSKNYFIVLICLLLAIAPSIAFIGKNIPPYRFVTYVSIFIPILFLFALYYFKNILNKRLFPILILLIVVVFAQNISIQHGWSGINSVDKDAIQFIKYNYNNSIKVSYGSPYYTLLNNTEWSSLYGPKIFLSKNEKDLLSVLKERYPNNDSVILIVTYQGYDVLIKSNPLFFDFMGKYEVYKKAQVEIYNINLKNMTI